MQELTTMSPDEVKTARAALGLSQTAFGEAVGAGLSTVQAWEAGTRSPLPMLRLAVAARVAGLEPWPTGRTDLKAYWAKNRDQLINSLAIERELTVSDPSEPVAVTGRQLGQASHAVFGLHVSAKERPDGTHWIYLTDRFNNELVETGVRFD